MNIPVDSDGYDSARDGKTGDNVIDAIERFARVLADRTAPREQRVEALKYLVHFVHDLHQPLHCADRNGDKGGNGRLVFFPGRKKGCEPAVWSSTERNRDFAKEQLSCLRLRRNQYVHSARSGERRDQLVYLAKLSSIRTCSG